MRRAGSSNGLGAPAGTARLRRISSAAGLSELVLEEEDDPTQDMRPARLSLEEMMRRRSPSGRDRSGRTSSGCGSQGALVPPSPGRSPLTARSERPPPPSPSSPKHTSLEDFTVLGLLGEGAFGKVMMAIKNDSQQIYAMKVLDKERLIAQGNASVCAALTEKEVLQDMADRPHPFIVGLKFAFQDAEHLFLVLDFVGGGSLLSLLDQKQRFPEAWVQVYAAEVVLALLHVHEGGIVYRDLKPENVMVGIDGHLMLTDFGTSKKLSLTTSTVCGTPEYLAPEVVLGQAYDAGVDWWTAGCIVHEMLDGRPPFKSEDMAAMVNRIVHGPTPAPRQGSAAALALLGALLCRDPSSRLGGERVKAHSFFEGLSWERLYRKQIDAPCVPAATGGRGGSNGGTPGAARPPIRPAFSAFTPWASGGERSPSFASSTSSFCSLESRSPRVSSLDLFGSDAAGAWAWGADGAAPATPAPLGERGGGQQHGAHELYLDLTRDGTVWQCSRPLSRLLGFTTAQSHCLIGHHLLSQRESIVDAGDLPLFAATFHALQARIDRAGAAGLASEEDEEDEEEGGEGGEGGKSGGGEGEGEDEGDAAPLVAAAAAGPKRLRASSFEHPLHVTGLGGRRLCVRCVLDRIIVDGEAEGEGEAEGGQLARATVRATFADVTRTEANKELVRKRFEYSYNEKLPDEALRAILSKRLAFGGTCPARTTRTGGLEAYLDRRRIFVRAFPDLHFVLLEQSVRGDDGQQVFTSFQMAGTHRGPYALEDCEIEPTGRRVLVTGVSIDSVADGRIVDHAAFYDEASLRAQIGAGERGRGGGPGGGREGAEQRTHVQLVLTTAGIAAAGSSKAAGAEGRRRRRWADVARGGGAAAAADAAADAGAAEDGARVRSFLHVAPAGAERANATALRVQEESRRYYARLFLRQLARLDVDGFALFDAAQSALPPVLTSRAFADAFTELVPRDSDGRAPTEQDASGGGGGGGGGGCGGGGGSGRFGGRGGGCPLGGRGLLQLTRPLARATSDDALQSLEAAVRTGRPLQQLLIAKLADGRPCNLVLCLQPFAADAPSRDAWFMPEGTSDGEASASFWAALLLRLDGEPAAPATPAAPAAPASPATPAAPASPATPAAPAAPASPSPSASVSASASASPSPSASPSVRHAAAPPRAEGNAGDARRGVRCGTVPPTAMAKRRLSGVRKTDDEALGSLFVHALPQAWAHGGEAALEALLSRALDEMQVGFTIADNLADDTPVVWLSRGFSRMTGYSFAQGVGRNCRFLQTEATDPAAVDKISAALRKGESVRVHLWNVSKSGRGFWNFLSLHRSRDIEDCVRYFLGFQLIIPRYQLLWLSRQQRGAGVASVEAPPSVPPPTK